LYLFEAAVADAVARAKGTTHSTASLTLDVQDRIAGSLSHDLVRVCGTRSPARCYALFSVQAHIVQIFKPRFQGIRVLEALEACDAKNGFLWRRTQQNLRLTADMPRKVLLGAPGRRSNPRLRNAACAFVMDPNISSLASLAASYDLSPTPALLRVPLVADRLFEVAFDSRLATEAAVLSASSLIAIAATAPTEAGDEPFLSTSDNAVSDAARTALATSTQVAIAVSARICLDNRLVTRPNEPEGKDGPRSRADGLRAASLPWPAARHGVIIFLRTLLESPAWLSSKLRNFAPTLIGLLRAYATCLAAVSVAAYLF
jgi:hypothetical protein